MKSPRLPLSVTKRIDSIRESLRVVSPVGWLVIFLGVSAWIAGWQFGWIEMIWIATAALVVLVCALGFLFGRTNLDISVSVDPQRVTVGDPSGGGMVVRNAGTRRLFPLRVELAVGRGATIFNIPSLASGAEHDELFILPTNRRQIIPVGPATSVRGDPLGLLRRAVDWTEPTPLYVHPKIALLENLGAGFLRDLEGQVTLDLSNSDVAFHALREYQPGDDRRFVHWKTTARVGSLMVRQFLDTRRSHLALLLDTRPEGYANDEEFELAVSIAGSLGTRALRDEQEVTFTTGIGPLGALNGQQMLDRLAGVKLGRKDRGLIQQAVEGAQGGSNASIVAMVTGSETPLTDTQAAAYRFGENLRVFVIRACPGGATSLKPMGSSTVLNVASLDEFAHLMWKVT